MGLLDDAIRDHLDLKRRRGAHPAEVERAERDALGPVRRVPVEAAEGELTLGPPAREDEYAGEEHVTEHLEWDEPFESADAAAAEPEPITPEPFDHGSPAHEPAAAEPVAAIPADPLEHDPFEHDPSASEPGTAEQVAAVHAEPPAPEPTPPPVHEPEPAEPTEDVEPRRRRRLFGRSESASEATVEYDVEDAIGAEAEHDDKGEDVLEETPEFLQDTPDHDRLWFEQKPPKDFDFDG